MARKKSQTDVLPDQPAETVPGENGAVEPQPEKPQESNGKKNPPIFKCGPIPTGRGESVSGCVWEREHVLSDGRSYKLHTIQMECHWFDEETKKWAVSKSLRTSQLAAYLYCLRRCSDVCFALRDPQAEIAF